MAYSEVVEVAEPFDQTVRWVAHLLLITRRRRSSSLAKKKREVQMAQTQLAQQHHLTSLVVAVLLPEKMELTGTIDVAAAVAAGCDMLVDNISEVQQQW